MTSDGDNNIFFQRDAAPGTHTASRRRTEINCSMPLKVTVVWLKIFSSFYLTLSKALL